VRGTTSILNSVLKHGGTVKRLVLTSSVAAVREGTSVPRVFTESNWNNSSVEAVETKGSAAGPVNIYMASKTLAEKAAWEFVATHKSEISWDLVVINPPWLFGASLFFPFPFAFKLSIADGSTRSYSPRSPPRRRSRTSTPPSARSMIPFLARGQASNCGLKETGCM
jgi:nucleoside-diphosphate-sugar epimerase